MIYLPDKGPTGCLEVAPYDRLGSPLVHTAQYSTIETAAVHLSGDSESKRILNYSFNS